MDVWRDRTTKLKNFISNGERMTKNSENDSSKLDPNITAVVVGS